MILIQITSYSHDISTYGDKLISGHYAFLFILILSLKELVTANAQQPPQ